MIEKIDGRVLIISYISSLSTIHFIPTKKNVPPMDKTVTNKREKGPPLSGGGKLLSGC
jgi:hypothetical protein